jgi:hypothetical protein
MNRIKTIALKALRNRKMTLISTVTDSIPSTRRHEKNKNLKSQRRAQRAVYTSGVHKRLKNMTAQGLLHPRTGLKK